MGLPDNLQLFTMQVSLKTTVKHLKEVVEDMYGISGKHQLRLWVGQDCDGCTAIVQGFPRSSNIPLLNATTIRRLNRIPVLWVTVHTRVFGQLPYRRPRDDGVSELELLYRDIHCGVDGSIIQGRTTVWISPSTSHVANDGTRIITERPN